MPITFGFFVTDNNTTDKTENVAESNIVYSIVDTDYIGIRGFNTALLRIKVLYAR